MKKLSKEKRQHLVLVVIITVGAMIGLWAGVIKTQTQSLGRIAERKAEADRKLQQVKQAIDSAEQTDARLCEVKKRLENIEDSMASGDLYSWAITTIRQFKLNYKVEIPQFSQIDGPRETSMLAAFPYKQATLSIAGTAFYHDLGRFVSDFENQYPYIRVQNLSLEPITAAGSEREKLSFKLQIVALVKPSAS
jgi:Tfp pilus assembly protein PilO